MSHFHFLSDGQVLAILFVMGFEGLFALLVFKLSRGISCVLTALMIMQAVVMFYIVTAPETLPGGADMGGMNFGPAIAFGLGGLVTGFVLLCCIIATIVISETKGQRKQ